MYARTAPPSNILSKQFHSFERRTGLARVSSRVHVANPLLMKHLLLLSLQYFRWCICISKRRSRIARRPLFSFRLEFRCSWAHLDGYWFVQSSAEKCEFNQNADEGHKSNGFRWMEFWRTVSNGKGPHHLTVWVKEKRFNHLIELLSCTKGKKCRKTNKRNWSELKCFVLEWIFRVRENELINWMWVFLRQFEAFVPKDGHKSCQLIYNAIRFSIERHGWAVDKVARKNALRSDFNRWNSCRFFPFSGDASAIVYKFLQPPVANATSD